MRCQRKTILPLLAALAFTGIVRADDKDTIEKLQKENAELRKQLERERDDAANQARDAAVIIANQSRQLKNEREGAQNQARTAIEAIEQITEDRKRFIAARDAAFRAFIQKHALKEDESAKKLQEILKLAEEKTEAAKQAQKLSDVALKEAAAHKDQNKLLLKQLADARAELIKLRVESKR